MSRSAWEKLAFVGFGLVFFALTLVVIKWTVAFVDWTTIDSGWAQTVGALIGLGLAIWLPQKQRLDDAKSALSAQRESEKRVCMAFRDELSILRKRAETAPNVIEILRDAPGEIFTLTLPTIKNRFPIFQANVGKIIEIESEAVRHAVIHAYEHANALAPIIDLNNKMLEIFNELHREQNRLGRPEMNKHELEFLFDEMAKLRIGMKQLILATVDHVDAALAQLSFAIFEIEAAEKLRRS